MKYKYGLIFKIDGYVLLACYKEKNGLFEIEENAESITDPIGVYEDLDKHCISFVRIQQDSEDDSFLVEDISVITICNPDEDKGVEDLIKDGKFMEIANDAFSEIMAKYLPDDYLELKIGKSIISPDLNDQKLHNIYDSQNEGDEEDGQRHHRES